MERIRKYEQVYEPISDRRLHYIKLIDMCGLSLPFLIVVHVYIGALFVVGGGGGRGFRGPAPALHQADRHVGPAARGC